MSEWISVKDRLPKARTIVIVFVNGKVAFDEYKNKYMPNKDNPWSMYKKEYVTHWMPLPEPPS